MEMTLQPELFPTKRQLCMLEGDTLAAPKFTKRRRRDHSAAVKEQLGEQQQPQAGQSATATTTTTTVKRSSRFRGVSRCGFFETCCVVLFFCFLFLFFFIFLFLIIFNYYCECRN